MLKNLLIVLGGFSGVSCIASLSSLTFINLDPKHLWRITNNNRFYLSNCSNIHRQVDENSRKTNSNLWIYLTVKDPQQTNIGEYTQLKLNAYGWSEQIEKTGRTVKPKSYSNKSLQETVQPEHGNSGRTSGSSDYVIQKGETAPTLISETAIWPDAETFGTLIKCRDNIFEIGEQPETSENISLDKVTFQLIEQRDTGNNKYKKYKDKGYKVYSIQISEEGKTIGDGKPKLKWATGFEPIVII